MRMNSQMTHSRDSGETFLANILRYTVERARVVGGGSCHLQQCQQNHGSCHDMGKGVTAVLNYWTAQPGADMYFMPHSGLKTH